MNKTYRMILVIESAVESRHEDVEIGLQRMQVLVSLTIDSADETRVEVVRVHGLRSNRENSIGDRDVDVGEGFGDAVEGID